MCGNRDWEKEREKKMRFITNKKITFRYEKGVRCSTEYFKIKNIETKMFLILIG